jgi:Acetamidase/Formamidase family
VRRLRGSAGKGGTGSEVAHVFNDSGDWPSKMAPPIRREMAVPPARRETDDGPDPATTATTKLNDGIGPSFRSASLDPVFVSCAKPATTPSTDTTIIPGGTTPPPPTLRIEPDKTIEFNCLDSSGGQISPASTPADVAKLDFGKINPVSGPVHVHVHVEDAAPGGPLKVTIEAFKPSDFGWTANLFGFGLLVDPFKDAAPRCRR